MLVDMQKDDNIYGKDGEEWERAYARQKRVRRALRDCVYAITQGSPYTLLSGVCALPLLSIFSIDVVVLLHVNKHHFHLL